MDPQRPRLPSSFFLSLFLLLQVMLVVSTVSSETSNQHSFSASEILKIEKDISEGGRQLHHTTEHNNEEKKFDLTATYVDASGALQAQRVNSKELSASWVRGSPDVDNIFEEGKSVKEESSKSNVARPAHQPSVGQRQQFKINKPEKWQELQKRKEFRASKLVQQDYDLEEEQETAAIERTKNFDTSLRRKYSIWRREHDNSRPDSLLKLMKDQVIMAKIYASIAHSRKQTALHSSLMNHIKEVRRSLGEANSDHQLSMSALQRSKSMGHALSLAKEKLYNSADITRKLRAMVQTTEEIVDAQKRKNTFLTQLAAKTLPKPLNCLSLHLTTDYYTIPYHGYTPDPAKLEDPNLYHYAIFSDNMISTSVVVNSTVMHARQPERHVFHIVTDKLNFAAMKMWFILHTPDGATVHVQNMDEFKWLNSSYCSVLRQLESAKLKDYYFKNNHPSSLSVGNDNLKYKNPKYLSMLNHLRFYLPELFPKLDKILFLDDDVVVQKDLTPLWSINMNGKVIGAVETCKPKSSFHRFKTYLNFSHPEISNKFDPQGCGWAFGMNIFDLKEWRKRNLTQKYHYWQDLNENRELWKLGSLPPGLLTFHGLSLPLDPSWHVLGLGYDPSVQISRIEKAAVIHYNGNYKPWLDLAISKFRKYWSNFIRRENSYIQRCHVNELT